MFRFSLIILSKHNVSTILFDLDNGINLRKSLRNVNTSWANTRVKLHFQVHKKFCPKIFCAQKIKAKKKSGPKKVKAEKCSCQTKLSFLLLEAR